MSSVSLGSKESNTVDTSPTGSYSSRALFPDEKDAASTKMGDSVEQSVVSEFQDDDMLHMLNEAEEQEEADFLGMRVTMLRIRCLMQEAEASEPAEEQRPDRLKTMPLRDISAVMASAAIAPSPPPSEHGRGSSKAGSYDGGNRTADLCPSVFAPAAAPGLPEPQWHEDEAGSLLLGMLKTSGNQQAVPFHCPGQRDLHLDDFALQMIGMKGGYGGAASTQCAGKGFSGDRHHAGAKGGAKGAGKAYSRRAIRANAAAARAAAGSAA